MGGPHEPPKGRFDDGYIERLRSALPERFGAVLKDPAKYRFQVRGRGSATVNMS